MKTKKTKEEVKYWKRSNKKSFNNLLGYQDCGKKKSYGDVVVKVYVPDYN